MSIELLYIVPIIALVIFTFTISLISQKRAGGFEQTRKLAAEVKQFNDGQCIPADKSTETRLDQFDHTIVSINKAISNQQKVIEKFHEENNIYNLEIDKLKRQLRELHKEYDILISENYSLRAKFKKLTKNEEADAGLLPTRIDRFGEGEPEAFISSHTSQPKAGYEISMSLYDDTKVYASNNFDDTKEYDMSDLMK